MGPFLNISKSEQAHKDAIKYLIEEVDIIDLQTELEEHATHEDVVRVNQNLCNVSENHLRAFVWILRLYEVDYEPLKLDQAAFDRILAE